MWEHHHRFPQAAHFLIEGTAETGADNLEGTPSYNIVIESCKQE